MKPILSGRAARHALPGLAVALLLAGCGSTPTHYYTLMPPPGGGAMAAAAPNQAAYQIEVQPVSLPAQVTTPQLVVRTGGGEMVPVDTRHWIAPLDEELRGALSANLTARLGVRDVQGLSGATGPGSLPTWRVGVTVQRFESSLGSAAQLDALWTLRLASDNNATPLTCASHIGESVQPGYDALVQGHQKAVADLAGQIAGSIDAARRGHAECPRF